MSPLHIEAFHPEAKRWVDLPEIKPGDPPGSFSQNKPDGSRELYIFECSEDDSQSTIYRPGFGVDVEVQKTRAIIGNRSNWEIVKVLKSGDEPFKLTIRTDRRSQRVIIRFTHKQKSRPGNHSAKNQPLPKTQTI